ncbi:MAG: MBOAT family protein [Deltaproteobacteria bacterium]|nr:MBOAT family protein [Deltaproteobacteria bacterium]
MLFNSYAFLFAFLPSVLLGFAAAAGRRSSTPAMAFLIVASLLFYGWWDWRCVCLLLGSLAGNFAAARWIERVRTPGVRRALLGGGMAANLAVLGYYKYAAFAVANLDALFGRDWTAPQVVLPLAISFFTFEQITYLVDAYHRRLPRHGLLHYATFLTFFPRLIAGPIVRPGELLPQLLAPRRAGGPLSADAGNLATGLFIFAIGLFKKAVLADTLSPWVGPVFDSGSVPPLIDAWGAALAFTLQLYFDFSGYTDMAIGLARMFGIRLPENFDSPYQARSISEFWRRWHITLSTFLRDYLYIPLGGNRHGEWRTSANLLVTMLLGGLWHGAGWTFVLWGGWHGVLLGLERQGRRRGLALPGPLAWGLTFTAVTVGLVLFRAPSLQRAGVMLAGLVGAGGCAWDSGPYAFGAHEWKRILPLLALVWFAPNRQAIVAWPWRSDAAYAAAFVGLTVVAVLSLQRPVPFVYFQF